MESTDTFREGIYAIDKPLGWTSFAIVGYLRRITGIKKIGHAGTLDPMATGVLVVGIGREFTRQLSGICGQTKEYLAEITFGVETDSWDRDGVVLHANGVESPWNNDVTPCFSVEPPCIAVEPPCIGVEPPGIGVEPSCIGVEPPCIGVETHGRASLSLSMIQAILLHYLGTITQPTPQFSAVHIAGVRSYQRARNEEEFTLPMREVTIYKMVLINSPTNIGRVARPCDPTDVGGRFPKIQLQIECSSGTYIRSIAYQLGQHLKCGAYLSALRRTRIGDFRIEDSHSVG